MPDLILAQSLLSAPPLEVTQGLQLVQLLRLVPQSCHDFREFEVNQV